MRAWIIKEHEAFVVQGADCDIVAQGATEDQAFRRWRLCVRGTMALNERDGKEPFENIPAAPNFYWREFGEPMEIDLNGPLPEENKINLPLMNGYRL